MRQLGLATPSLQLDISLHGLLRNWLHKNTYSWGVGQNPSIAKTNSIPEASFVEEEAVVIK
jgi:hypothetical protein